MKANEAGRAAYLAARGGQAEGQASGRRCAPGLEFRVSVAAASA
jgi:hypothetical protein